MAEKAALLGIAQTEAEDLRKQLTHNLEDYREKLGQYMRETTTIIRNTAEEVRRPVVRLMRCHGWLAWDFVVRTLHRGARTSRRSSSRCSQC